MGSPVVHFEVGAADDGPLVAFYGELFHWELQGFSGGAGSGGAGSGGAGSGGAGSGAGYTMIDTRGGLGINGGIGRSQSGEPWSTFYVETGDLQATLDKANSLGGATVLPVTDLGGGLTIAMFSDPDGLLIGLTQAPAEPSEGDGPAPSAGSGEPVTWFEIFGSDAARTQQFYADLFGWTVDSSGFPGYAVVGTGSDRGIQGGIGGGLDARWATVYAKVASVEEALGHAEKLGGSRIRDPEVAALKSAARLARYGGAEGDVTNETFRDPAGNIFGVFNY